MKLDHSSESDQKFGTVDAVAADGDGNVAAATSTGGLTNKAWGRIGDSPIIGAGTYAKITPVQSPAPATENFSSADWRPMMFPP